MCGAVEGVLAMRAPKRIIPYAQDEMYLSAVGLRAVPSKACLRSERLQGRPGDGGVFLPVVCMRGVACVVSVLRSACETAQGTVGFFVPVEACADLSRRHRMRCESRPWGSVRCRQRRACVSCTGAELRAVPKARCWAGITRGEPCPSPRPGFPKARCWVGITRGEPCPSPRSEGFQDKGLPAAVAESCPGGRVWCLSKVCLR